MLRWSVFLTLIIYVCFSVGIKDFILRWRNELAEPIKYIRGSDIGRTNEYREIEISTEYMVSCIQFKHLFHKVLIHQFYDEVIQFENVFQLFGSCVCDFITNSSFLQSPCDATIDYSNAKLQNRRYQKFNVKRTMGTMKFFDQSNSPDKTENVFIKTVTNRGSTDVTSTVALTFEKGETVTTSSSNEIGGSVGGSVELKFGVFEAKAEVEASYSYTSTSENEESKKSSLTVERTFTIPPHSSRQIVCFVKKQDLDFVWEIPVFINGFVAINMDTTREDDWIFVDVKYVAKYFTELSLSRSNPPQLQGFIRGRTRGSKHFDADAVDHPSDMTLTPVQEDMCNPLPSTAKK